MLCPALSNDGLTKGVGTYGAGATFGLKTVRVNSFIGSTTHTYSFMYYLWLLSNYKDRAEYLQQRPDSR